MLERVHMVVTVAGAPNVIDAYVQEIPSLPKLQARLCCMRRCPNKPHLAAVREKDSKKTAA